MIDRFGLDNRRSASRYGGGLNRAHSPLRARTVPYLSIMAGSVIPVVFLADVMPLLPPLGFMALLCWRLMRPGFLPLWAGIPLGAFDDLFSGQPFGSAILLWTLTMFALEVIETRLPWRGFWQDWFTAGPVLVIYMLAAMVVSGASLSTPLFLAAIPQIVIAVLLYPLFARGIAWLDRFRLARSRRLG